MQGNWTWAAAIRVWWAFTWRALLAGFLGAFVVGLLVGFVEGLLGGARHPAMGAIIGVIWGTPASVWAMRSALGRTYSGFRITFTSTH